MATGKYAWAISERSGFAYPYREMIREPGTNVFIHYSESDGMYNAVDHPQNRVGRKGVEFEGLINAHPDRDEAAQAPYWADENGTYITDEQGNLIEL